MTIDAAHRVQRQMADETGMRPTRASRVRERPAQRLDHPFHAGPLARSAWNRVRRLGL